MNPRPDTSTATTPLIEGGHDFASLTNLVCGLVERRAPLWWRLSFAIAATLATIGGLLTIYVI